MGDKEQSDKNNEIRDLRERQSQLTTAIELAIAVVEARELSREGVRSPRQTLDAIGSLADYYAAKLAAEPGWQARLRAMATGGTWHTYTSGFSRPIGPGLGMALASMSAGRLRVPEPSTEWPEEPELGEPLFPTSNGNGNPLHETTRLSERLLRLEALLLDPAELAKEPAEALEQLRQMPGGAPLQLGRLANLEEAVEQTAALGDGLARIATVLERAAGVQEELAAPIDAGGCRHLLRSPPCPACGCLIRVEAGELFGSDGSDGCPGCGAERQSFLSWGHLVDLGLAAFDRQDQDRDRVLAEVVTRRGALEPTTPEGAALVAAVIREGVVVPPAADERPTRSPLPDGCEYPIRVAATSFERGPISVSFSVAAVETLEPGKAPVDARALWGCRCGERYELTATAAPGAHGWQSQPLEPNGTERQLAADLAALVQALPRCEDCGHPATRIGTDGDERDALCLCDTCRPEQRLWEVETPQKETIDGMMEPEVRWADALRRLRTPLGGNHG